MSEPTIDHFVCPICHVDKPSVEGRPAEFISGPVGELIRREHADWGAGHVICHDCLHRFRNEYLTGALQDQRGELTAVEQEVLSSLREHEMISRNVEPEFEETMTFGQHLSDRLADIGGSWMFILFFASMIVCWIVVNSTALISRPYDPYPYILLNLVLSCIAAIQAPIIMMSQNRQEAKDRLRAEHDYQINLKAEIEIRHLHTKLDQLIHNSWQRLLEIQQVQIDLMEELLSGRQQDSK